MMDLQYELEIEEVVLNYDLECDEIELEYELEVGVGTGDILPYYKGPYSVKPKVRSQQILNTKQHSMKEDVVVEEIPYTEVHNTKGLTFIIGGE